MPPDSLQLFHRPLPDPTNRSLKRTTVRRNRIAAPLGRLLSAEMQRRNRALAVLLGIG